MSEGMKRKKRACEESKNREYNKQNNRRNNKEKPVQTGKYSFQRLSRQFMSNPQLTVDMVKEIIDQDVFTIKYIVADSIYGNSPDFIEEAQAQQAKAYFGGVSSRTQCWLRRPSTLEKEYQHRNKKKNQI